MNPIRRELLNGLLVLVVASLLSVAFSAFQVSFNALLWVLILMGIAIAVSGYILFEITLGVITSAEDREKERLKRVGTPARLELNRDGEVGAVLAIADTVAAMSPGSAYTVMFYYGSEGGAEPPHVRQANATREKVFSIVLERLKLGTTREYKRIICFDNDVLENDHELKSGVLRVGEGPGTIDRAMGEHCRLMMEIKGCSLYVAPIVLRAIVGFYGLDAVSMTVETADRRTGGRIAAGTIFFSDPPNGEILDQLRQMERETERRMVAVHKIVFPEDIAPTAEATTG